MPRILDKVDSPKDLAPLSLEELHQLASEIRELIVNTVSETGGHLAPSLGVVELAIALHRTLDSPTDKIIWDVGHQAYAHKILTSRRDRFKTLRQYKGISGFPRIEESVHDVFGVGHSSTSISVALGLAAARDSLGENHHVVAVIGDGALTGGMAFEALNHAGSLNMDFTVILNDNEMSISRNVGAMSGYLSRIITGQFYNQAKADIEDFVNRIPRIGPKLKRLLNRMEESLKGFIVPGVLFEELGFRYFGPIDGHSLPELVETLDNIWRIKGPTFLHVITKKGKGYQPAEDFPTHFHGTGPFNKVTGVPLKSEKQTYTDVFGRVITDIASKDPRVVVITPAMTFGSGLTEFAEKLPAQFFDVGIAEQHAVTFAAALARGGMKPVVAIYSTFLQRAIDQVIHDVCLQNQPVVFAIDRAGLVGADGATHHGVFDIAFLRMIPNLVVMAPANEIEFELMLPYALSLNQPVAIRYPRDSIEGDSKIKPVSPVIDLGRAQIVVEGSGVAILTLGPTLNRILEILPELKKLGVNPTLVNMRFLKPLDDSLLQRLIAEGFKIVTVEEHVLTSGFGSAVLESIDSFGSRKTATLRLGIPDHFVEHGARKELLKTLRLSAEDLIKKISSFALDESL